MDNDFLAKQTPAAMFIEMAQDALQREDSRNKVKELHEACGDVSADFENGFLLGYKTAEVMLRFTPNLKKED